MADRDKNEHISESTMERFSVRSLSEAELTKVATHLSACPVCQENFVSTLRRQRGDADLSFTLAPEFWLRHEHLEYDQLVDLADDKLEVTDREFIEDHLNVCPPCREDIRSFLAFRQQIAREMRVSYAPVEQESALGQLSKVSWWRSLVWKPVYSAAVVVIGIASVIGIAFLLTRRTDNLQVQQVPTPQVSPPTTPAVVTASPSESPAENLTHAERVVLNDQGRTITVYKSGTITGLDEVPDPARNEIAQVLLSGSINRPAILRDLGGDASALRGTNRSQPFKLVAPKRTAILSNRPTFTWEKVSGATAYTVYVSDASGQLVAKSDALTSDHRDWPVPKSLKRGEVYAWTVTAVVEGKEITSPGPSAPEMKFQVLPLHSLQQLRQLQKARSHLALGVFYTKFGMIDEAEREFQKLSRLNPHDRVSTSLLRRVRALRQGLP